MPAYSKPATITTAVAVHILRWWVAVFSAGVVGLGIAAFRYMEWLS